MDPTTPLFHLGPGIRRDERIRVYGLPLRNFFANGAAIFPANTPS